MALRSARIDVSQANGEVLFRFTAPDGPVSAMMLSVLKAHAREPIEPEWLLMPAGGVIRRFPYTSSTTRLEQVEPLGDQCGGVADEWDQRMLSDEHNGLLSEVVYGQVPPGFQQAEPASGPARALQAGVTYVVAVLGACHGQATFTI